DVQTSGRQGGNPPDAPVPPRDDRPRPALPDSGPGRGAHGHGGGPVVGDPGGLRARPGRDAVGRVVTGPLAQRAEDLTAQQATRVRWPRRWPLVLLALPAGVATWSGWVGLGELTGFGPVKPLPGIADSLTINSAITLPIGVEAYAALAMSAWLTS